MARVKSKEFELQLGAKTHGSQTTFTVWAPFHKQLLLKIEGQEPILMEQEGGYHTLTTDAKVGQRYFLQFEDGTLRPDPVSRLLPEGVHGPTEIVNPSFAWNDESWSCPQLSKLILYELHVGTFTKEGSFDAVIEKLDHLLELGINCIELMPVAQCPGRWNWGYDGASLFACSRNYGGPDGLKRLVNACHNRGIAVCLDVVYNHFGPEGCYLAEFGPYFHENYQTPWGKALNYDSAYSDEVRRFISDNANYWVQEYHIDLLRLDAIHGIYDFSATPMLSELSPCQIIAEDERNDCRYIRNQNFALWNDDFHHALHSLLTGEKQSYYSDFNGLESLARCLDRGLVYDGNYSNFRKKRQGNSSKNVPYSHFISFIQNHDQVGNRPEGERLGQLVSKEREKIAAAIHILSPMTPMLFMGQEYGEQNPFQYFVDFEDQKLMEAVTEGRKREFHSQQMPHPGQESFENSKLSWEKDEALFVAYKQLLEIRKQFTPKEVTSENVVVDRGESWLSWEYPTNRGVLNILLVWGECHHKPVGRVIYSTKPIPADWNFQDELLLVQIRS